MYSGSGFGCVFVFQAEDGIRELVRSRGLGDVYKRQQQFRGGRGGGRALVGDHVGNTEVHFVPDGGDDGQFAGGDSPGDYFFVEGPEILDRAAASGQDDGLEAQGPRAPVEGQERPRHLGGRPPPLDPPLNLNSIVTQQTRRG